MIRCFGRVDVGINATGANVSDLPVLETTIEDLEHPDRDTVHGPFRFFQQLVGDALRRSIIQISSRCRDDHG